MAIKLMEENEKRAEEQARRRQQEWDKRESKIKNAMSRMADTVLKKNNAAEKEVERRALQYAEEKDRREELREQ